MLKSQLSVVGSTAGTLKVIVDELREEGIKAGVLRLRTFRPFPVEELRNALKNIKAVAVMDKSMSPGGLGGAVFNEVRNALYDAKHASTNGQLHFRFRRKRQQAHVTYEESSKTYSRIAKTGQVEKQVHYLGLRE